MNFSQLKDKDFKKCFFELYGTPDKLGFCSDYEKKIGDTISGI